MLSRVQKLQLLALNGVGHLVLRQFRRRTISAARINRDTLAVILRTNAFSDFGRQRSFSTLSKSRSVVSAYRREVPLTDYPDYTSWIDRIAQGEANVLTTEPIVLLAGTAGTTDSPKRIPMTSRGQNQAAALVGIAPRAVIQAGILKGSDLRRGINLMSLYTPARLDRGLSLSSAPNAGMQRIRRQIPLLFTSPVAAFQVQHQPTAQYLHALYGLQAREALCIGTPFAPQLVGWLGLIERAAEQLVADIAEGTLASSLVLTNAERTALTAVLQPNRIRAREVETALARGTNGLIPNLWPTMRYLNTITSGSFAACLPRLRSLAGPDVPIHSPAYGASEGVIGVNLETDGLGQYVLAVGTSYFEFIPVDHIDIPDPQAVGLEALSTGQDYEVVVTNRSGLYRYRLGDIVRVTGFHGTAPRLDFQYRRGTILNLVNEKMTEFHTYRALSNALKRDAEGDAALKDYTVHGTFRGSRGSYTFYVETNTRNVAGLGATFPGYLDEELGRANPYYRINGRDLDRLEPPIVKLVQPGTFEQLAAHLANRTSGILVSQMKTPRRVTLAEHLKILESGVMWTGIGSAHAIGGPGA